jgi:type I restriction enzyme S subunit
MSSYPQVTLAELCQIIAGGTPKREVKEYFGGSIPWATPTDVTGLDNLEIDATQSTLTEAGLRSSSAKLLPAGAVLLTSRATIGYTAIARVPMCTNQGFANFICGPRILPEYLAAWLPTQRTEMLRLAGHTTFKEVSKSNLKRLAIPLPPLEEQRRIVDILNHAASIRRLREEARAKAKELIPALFLDMFGDPAANPKGWEIAAIGSVIDGAQYGTSKKAHENGHGLPVLRMGNVTYEGDLDLTDLKCVELHESELAKGSLRGGDILFNRTNSKDLVGKTGLWYGRFDAVAASYFVRVRVKRDLLHPYYLWAFMNSAYMKRRLFETARGAIGQANINAKELRSFTLPRPPLRLQDAFAERVADVQATIDQMDRAAAAAEQLQAALMARLFAGS